MSMRTLCSSITNAADVLRRADAVCFDVDSTVITSEGIDDLADYLGCKEKVAELTAKAMGGSMPFHEALALRLDAMRYVSFANIRRHRRRAGMSYASSRALVDPRRRRSRPCSRKTQRS